MFKKIVKVFPLVLMCLLGTVSFSSCGTPFKMDITYGTYIPNEDDYKGVMLNSFDNVTDKIDLFKESFILTVLPGNEDCSCWWTFRSDVLNKLTTQKKVQNYAIRASTVQSASDARGFEYSSSSPILYFVNGQNNTKMKFNYSSGPDSIFVNYNAFLTNLEKYCTYPKMYSVNEQYLNNNLSSKDKQIVYFYRSTCGDCQDALPNVITPYIKENYNVINKEIWAIDVDPIRSQGEVPYQAFKDRWKLSDANDKIYGYTEGVVPTFQYYENGNLKDMDVYFNDGVSKNEEGVYSITQTYFTPERISHLHYLPSSVEPLLGKILPESQVHEWGGWKEEYARKYHANFTKYFLDTYLK